MGAVFDFISFKRKKKNIGICNAFVLVWRFGSESFPRFFLDSDPLWWVRINPPGKGI